MPPPTRPHRGHGSMTGRSSGSAPMSERQQMALLMQMTSTTEAGKLNKFRICEEFRCSGSDILIS